MKMELEIKYSLLDRLAIVAFVWLLPYILKFGVSGETMMPPSNIEAYIFVVTLFYFFILYPIILIVIFLEEYEQP